MNGRLFRSPDDRVLAGVAGGMAEAYDLDPALVRVGWALLTLLTGGVFLVVYIVMALVVPLRPASVTLWATAGAGGGTGTEPGPGTDTSDPTQPPMSRVGSRGTHDRNGMAGAVVLGAILVVVGMVFLARQLIPAINFGQIWPIIAIAGGLLLIVAAFARRRPDA
jgi:phage shock protein C